MDHFLTPYAKNKLKMYWRLKCKIWNHNTSRRKHKKHTLWHWSWKHSFGSAALGKDRKSKKKMRWQPTPAFLLGKFQGERSLASYNPWGQKESDPTEKPSMHTSTMKKIIGEIVAKQKWRKVWNYAVPEEQRIHLNS